MPRILPIIMLCVLAMTGCAREPDQSVQRTETLVNGKVTGEWRVISLGGEAISPVDPVTLRANDEVIYWEPGCAGWSIPYTLSNGSARFGAEPNTGVIEVCSIGYPESVPEIFRTFAAATTYTRQADGSVVFTGPASSVVIAPAAAPVEAPVVSLAGEWRLTVLNGHEAAPVRFSGDAQQFGWATTCARQARRYNVTGTRFAAEPLGDLPPPPPVRNGQPPIPQRHTCALPSPAEVLRVLSIMDRATTIKPYGANRVFISDGKGRDFTIERVDTPEDLIGEWRVAGIDGRALVGNTGIAVTITGDRIEYEPKCAGFVWNYTYANAVIATVRAKSINARPPGEPPAPVCAVAVSPEARQLGAALDRVTRARYTAAGGIRLSGGGRSVTLFSQ